MRKFLSIFLFFLVLMPATVNAASTDTNDKLFSFCVQNPTSEVCKERAKQNQSPSVNPVNHIIRVAAGIITLATGVAAVIFVILGGVTMITSSGSPEAVANARKRIIYALVGLVIISLAWAMIAFVTDKVIL
jgi:energy-coupling factor transporter transmembrane protein EcfT